MVFVDRRISIRISFGFFCELFSCVEKEKEKVYNIQSSHWQRKRPEKEQTRRRRISLFLTFSSFLVVFFFILRSPLLLTFCITAKDWEVDLTSSLLDFDFFFFSVFGLKSFLFPCTGRNKIKKEKKEEGFISSTTQACLFCLVRHNQRTLPDSLSPWLPVLPWFSFDFFSLFFLFFYFAASPITYCRLAQDALAFVCLLYDSVCVCVYRLWLYIYIHTHTQAALSLLFSLFDLHQRTIWLCPERRCPSSLCLPHPVSGTTPSNDTFPTRNSLLATPRPVPPTTTKQGKE